MPGAWQHAAAAPSEGRAPDGLAWQPAGDPQTGSDALDHWFRLDQACPAGSVLEFQGLATWTEVWLDGLLAARHSSMFRPFCVTVPPGGARRVEVCARALTPDAVRPRARWRNRLVPGEGLRTVRTSLLGRIGGADAPVVGPFRPMLLHPPGGPVRRRVRAWLEGRDGVVEVRLAGPGIGAGRVRCGEAVGALVPDGTGVSGRLRVAGAALWWPHTHGSPVLHRVEAEPGGWLGDVGFRRIERVPGEGFGLLVNGVPVFCRGALWGGRAGLERMPGAGLNMVRVPGGTLYPPSGFYDAADRLGILVWQNFMFTRFDYPATAEFLEEARVEAEHLMEELGHRPSLAVLCGGDEVAQAAAMAGRPAAEWAHPLFDAVLAGVAARCRPDVPYVPNAPHGGVPPFAASAPVAHYFGVGAYQRPLHEAAGVRFAAACLAFSNPADAEGCRTVSAVPGDAAWAQAVPRDPGAAWTFEDVRDHYAATLLRADMGRLRRTDPERWLAMGRAGVALAMQSALATWRCDPACGGALVLGWEDVVPGPGWGVLDQMGRAKSALHAMAAVSQPVQVLLRDAGLDGVVATVFNDSGAPCAARLRLRGLTPSGEEEALGAMALDVPAHGSVSLPAVAVMGRFVDLVGTWRFGPPPYRVLGAVLEREEEVLSTATLFVDAALPPERLGLTAVFEAGAVRVGTARFAQFVTIDAGRHEAERDHFHLWPGESLHVGLRGEGAAAGSVTALNGTQAAHFRGMMPDG